MARVKGAIALPDRAGKSSQGGRNRPRVTYELPARRRPALRAPAGRGAEVVVATGGAEAAFAAGATPATSLVKDVEDGHHRQACSTVSRAGARVGQLERPLPPSDAGQCPCSGIR